MKTRQSLNMKLQTELGKAGAEPAAGNAGDKPSAQGVEHVVEESRAISLTVQGGTMTGEFVRGASRTSKDGGIYNGWILKNAEGVGDDYKTHTAVLFPKARYFIFSTQRLDRLMREVEKGDRIRIVYLGLMENEIPGPEGDYGKHHAFKVVILP